MVMTNTLKKKQKEKPIHYKENNPARQFMSCADAIVDNARLKADRDAIDSYKTELKMKRTAPTADAPSSFIGNTTIEPTTNEKKITKLEEQLEAERGPGSHIRKQKIQVQIDELKGDS